MLSQDHRGAKLARLGAELADKVAARRDDLVHATAVDLRFPVADMRREVDRTVSVLRNLELAGPWIEGRAPICGPDDSVALLLPYNLGSLALQLIASVAIVGNPVTVRFSSRAPTLARLCEEILATMALPARVTLDGRPAPEFLDAVLADPHYPVLLAYGGDRLGEELRSALPGTKIIFEGPGKDPLVVGRNADPVRVRELVRSSKFSRSGQECISIERMVLVGDQEEVLEAIVELAAGLYAVPDWDADADVTPLASSAAPRTIAAQLEEAVARGARILTGGGVRGDFVEPTVVVDVPVDCSLWQDETFGPVLPVRTAPDIEAAVAAGLSGRYGLHGIVTGADAEMAAAHMVGEPYAIPVPALRYGQLGVVTTDRQQFTEPEDDYRPFGGWGVSGWGREADGTLTQGPRVLLRETTRALAEA